LLEGLKIPHYLQLDAMLIQTIPKAKDNTIKASAINPFREVWTPSKATKHVKLPENIKNMVLFAKQYKLLFEHPTLSEEQITEQLAWLHFAYTSEKIKTINSKIHTHMREEHAIWSIGNLQDFANRQS
jgi:hypothetical protein